MRKYQQIDIYIYQCEYTLSKAATHKKTKSWFQRPNIA